MKTTPGKKAVVTMSPSGEGTIQIAGLKPFVPKTAQPRPAEEKGSKV
jgi:hypothetical protein